MGKVHGSLAQAGKVRTHTPKVERQEKREGVKGRARLRLQYSKRFLTENPSGRRRVGPNQHQK